MWLVRTVLWTEENRAPVPWKDKRKSQSYSVLIWPVQKDYKSSIHFLFDIVWYKNRDSATTRKKWTAIIRKKINHPQDTCTALGFFSIFIRMCNMTMVAASLPPMQKSLETIINKVYLQRQSLGMSAGRWTNATRWHLHQFPLVIKKTACHRPFNAKRVRFVEPNTYVYHIVWW